MKLDSSAPAISLTPSTMRRWLAGGATLAGSALAGGTASAGVVQIDLVGNEASTSGSVLTDSSYGDLTGDGIDDLTSSSDLSFRVARSRAGIRGSIAGVGVAASFTSYQYTSSTSSSSYTSSTFRAFVGSSSASASTPTSRRGLIPVTFTDARINGGGATDGFIEVFAENISRDDHRIELVRLIFDDESAAAPMVDISEQYPHFSDTVNIHPTATSTAAKRKLEKKITVLNRKIRDIKKNAAQNTPRLNFYRLPASRIRQLAALERQLAALQRKLGSRGR